MMMTEEQQIREYLRKYYSNIAELGLQEEIAHIGKVIEFKSGEIIMDFGAYVKLIPLVVEGSIKVSREGDDGGEIFLYYLQPGESCTMSFTCCMMNKRSDNPQDPACRSRWRQPANQGAGARGNRL